METKILGSKVSINRRYLFLFGLASGISSLYLSAIGIIEELRLIWEFFFRSTCQTGWISSIDIITFDIPLSLTRRQPIVSTANETNVFCYYFYLAGSVRWCDNCVQIVRLNWDMATITRDNCPCGLCIILNLYIVNFICVRFVLELMLECSHAPVVKRWRAAFASAKTSFERNRVCFARFISSFFFLLLLACAWWKHWKHEKQLCSLHWVKLRDENFLIESRRIN